MYISFNGGENWQPFQLNLPVVPITDLAFHKREQELVVATQGRAFWIFDDVPLLYQLSPAALERTGPLVPAERRRPRRARRLRDPIRPVWDKIPRAASPSIIRSPHRAATYRAATVRERSPSKSSTPTANPSRNSQIEKRKTKARPIPKKPPSGRPSSPDKLPAEPGLNRFVWNLRYADATKFPGLIMWAGNVEGPVAAPGKYSAKLTIAGISQTQTFTVRPDPRLKTKPEDYAAQLALALQIRDKLSAVNQAVIEIREAKKQLARYEKEDKVSAAAKSLDQEAVPIEEALYQTKLKAGEDALNFPIKLNNKLAALKGDIEDSDTAPTRQEQQVFEDLATQSNAELEKLKSLFEATCPPLINRCATPASPPSK